MKRPLRNEKHFPSFCYYIDFLCEDEKINNKTKKILLDYIIDEAIPYIKKQDDILASEALIIIRKLELYRDNEIMQKVFEDEISKLTIDLNAKENYRILYKSWLKILEKLNSDTEYEKILSACCFTANMSDLV